MWIAAKNTKEEEQREPTVKKIIFIASDKPRQSIEGVLFSLGVNKVAVYIDDISQTISPLKSNMASISRKVIGPFLETVLNERAQNGESLIVIPCTEAPHHGKACARLAGVATHFGYDVVVVDLDAPFPIPLTADGAPSPSPSPSPSLAGANSTDSKTPRTITSESGAITLTVLPSPALSADSASPGPRRATLSALRDFEVTGEEGLKALANPRFEDLSGYEKVFLVGDIHGCSTELDAFVTENGVEDDRGFFELDPSAFYIFCGDYLDRGYDNAGVLDRVCEWAGLPNTMFLRGNHEYHLAAWAGMPVAHYWERDAKKPFPSAFSNTTKRELEATGFSSVDVQRFLRATVPFFPFGHCGKKFVASHCGSPSVLTEGWGLRLAEREMVGRTRGMSGAACLDASYERSYREAEKEGFDGGKKVDAVMIHGHRASRWEYWTHPHSVNLEGAVEAGGALVWCCIEQGEVAVLGETQSSTAETAY